MKEGVILVSTRATDILLRPDGSVISEQEGGPMMYMEAALADADVPFDTREGEKMRVEIEVRDDGEYGRIPPASIKKHLSEIATHQWCVVSTLLDEWVLDGNIPENLMVDLQGYVRDGSAFGKKQAWPVTDEVTRKIFCLKGTEEEVGYLPLYLAEEQRLERLLVTTLGREGVVIDHKGIQFHVPAQVVDNLPDTVGAGDTFFAYFAAALYGGQNPHEAAIYASEKTALFLSGKIVDDQSL